jgi:hypothetical protein
MLQTYNANYINMAKAGLKVLKDNCSRLISLYHLKSLYV